MEDSINSMFRIARFRLFREQANGGVEDRCDVVVGGVPYISINNGMKINVGIDDVVMHLYISDITGKRWHSEFIALVGSCYGYLE